MNEQMTAQLRIIKAVLNALDAAGISAWLFGGWGLDARIGRITREHGDVEFWVERIDAGRSKAVLVEAAPRRWRLSRPRKPASSAGTAPASVRPTLTGGQTGRSASLKGGGRTGYFRPAPSAASPGCSMACRCRP
jgi:hypothetical protein